MSEQNANTGSLHLSQRSGGPAFPTYETPCAGPLEGVATFEGMSLRDYFAARVLPECLGNYFQGVKDGDHGWDTYWERGVALEAYSIADTMLAIRAEGRT